MVKENLIIDIPQKKRVDASTTTMVVDTLMDDTHTTRGIETPHYLHDCIALGAYEYGLPPLSSLLKMLDDTNDDHHHRGGAQRPATTTTTMITTRTEPLLPPCSCSSGDDDDNHDTVAQVTTTNNTNTNTNCNYSTIMRDEIQRLPILLRLLHESQSFASMSSITDVFQMTTTNQEKQEKVHFETSTKDDDTTTKNTDDVPDSDVLLDTIVQRMEERATYYHRATFVDQMVNEILVVTPPSNASTSTGAAAVTATVMYQPLSQLPPSSLKFKRNVTTLRRSNNTKDVDVDDYHYDTMGLESLLQQQPPDFESMENARTAINETTMKPKKKSKKQARRESITHQTNHNTNQQTVASGGDNDENDNLQGVVIRHNHDELPHQEEMVTAAVRDDDNVDIVFHSSTKKRLRDTDVNDTDVNHPNNHNHHEVDRLLQGNIEDTLEYKVYQTTLEMIQITIATLQPLPSIRPETHPDPPTRDDNDDDDEKNDHRSGSSHNHVSLPLSSFPWEDSILASTPSSVTTQTSTTHHHHHDYNENVSTMDVSSTISSIMYGAPVLRHRHVAVRRTLPCLQVENREHVSHSSFLVLCG